MVRVGEGEGDSVVRARVRVMAWRGCRCIKGEGVVRVRARPHGDG